MNTTIKQQKTIAGKKRPYFPVFVCDQFNDELKIAGEFAFAVVPDFEHAEKTRQTIRMLLKSAGTFVLIVEETVKLRGEAISLIIQCLFSPNYLRISGQPVLAFLSSEERLLAREEFNEYRGETEFKISPDLVNDRSTNDASPGVESTRQLILRKLNAQGWSSVITWNLHRKPNGLFGNTAQFPVVVSQLEDEAGFTDLYLRDLHTVSDYILFHAETFDRTLALEQEFNTSLHHIIQQYPLLKKGLWDFVHEKQTATRLKAENAALNEKLANAEKTISVIRHKYKDDYENLFKWYHNEYEILPLWYKRVGHVLKVLMGKRSFRSLFNDDVKKYKS